MKRQLFFYGGIVLVVIGALLFLSSLYVLLTTGLPPINPNLGSPGGFEEQVAGQENWWQETMNLAIRSLVGMGLLAAGGILMKVGNEGLTGAGLAPKPQPNGQPVSIETSKEENQMDQVLSILFMAANPTDTTQLRLGEESRKIDQELRLAEYRDRFELEQAHAVRVGDLQGLLLRYQPHIVHFSGHGSEDSEIILEDNMGNSHPVSSRALSSVFSILKDNIRCVVLNACYSEPQAEAIAEHIDCVVGMSEAIGDKAAISFATAFYRALGFGRNVKTAFDLGCAQIDLENIPEEQTPQLIATRVDPAQIVLTSTDG